MWAIRQWLGRPQAQLRHTIVTLTSPQADDGSLHSYFPSLQQDNKPCLVVLLKIQKADGVLCSGQEVSGVAQSLLCPGKEAIFDLFLKRTGW